LPVHDFTFLARRNDVLARDKGVLARERT